MRKDPIISEDWTVGNTSYFDYGRFQRFEFVISFLISVFGIYVGFDKESFIVIFMWLIILFGVIILELIIDQRDRGVSSRLVVLSVLLFFGFLTMQDLDDIYSIIIGTLFAIKFLIIPIQNFIQEYNTEILVPNTQKVEFVLKDHVSRLNETNFMVESNEEFKERVVSKIKEFILILIGAVMISVLTFGLLYINETISKLIMLVLVVFSSFSFSYTTVSWYIDKREKLKEKELADKEIDEDAVFPEEID